MTESSYDLMFSKLGRSRLFDMYFAEAQQVLASLVLQPADDPRVDVTACVSKLLYMCSRFEGNFVPVSWTNLMHVNFEDVFVMVSYIGPIVPL
jgi:hypothetical protein